MAMLAPANAETVLITAVAEILVEDARRLCACAARLAEKAEELVVEARAQRAQRAFTRAAWYGSRPSGT